MTRSSLERGRITALLLLCACTPGQVLDPLAPAPAAAGMQPSAAGHGGRGDETAAQVLPPPAAAVAGRSALQMDVQQSSGGRGPQPAVSEALPEHVLGVTLTDVAPLDTISEALSSLSHKPTVRVVFDVQRRAITYVPALRSIAAVSFVMGEVVDSVVVDSLSTDAYATRTSEYLDELGDVVDIWEIGNEVNGEWLGPTDKVQAKIVAAYRLVRERGKRSALTLYYNQGCVQKPEHELFTWAANNIPADMRAGLDYVWVSYYAQRCHSAEPDWKSVFTRLREQFPHARLGFGGVGTTEAEDKAELVRHFYRLNVPVSGFVGGYFWWYFREDMLPSGAPLWNVLNDSWLGSPL